MLGKKLKLVYGYQDLKASVVTLHCLHDIRMLYITFTALFYSHQMYLGYENISGYQSIHQCPTVSVSSIILCVCGINLRGK